MLGRFRSFGLLKRNINGIWGGPNLEERLTASTGCYHTFWNSTDSSSSPPPQESSLFRSLIGVTVIIGGASVAIYFNQSARDLITQQFPQVKSYFNRIDEFVEGWTPKSLPNLPSLPTSSLFFDKTTDKPSEYSDKESSLSPNFPSVADVSKQLAEVPEYFKNSNSDLQSCIRNSENAVLLAIDDLKNLRKVTKSRLDDYHRSSGKQSLPLPPSQKLESAQIKAIASHQAAQRNLAGLRSLLDNLKTSVSQKDNELVQTAIRRYGELAYELSGLVNEVRSMQTDLAISSDFTEATNSDRSRLYQDIQSILPKSVSMETPFMKVDGSEMTKEELNALLSMALERIEKLCCSLENISLQAKQHLVSTLRTHRNVTDQLIREAIERELSLERNKHEIERFKWDEESKAKLESELDLALARHGHHLAQMLRLKQDEMEHSFDYRLREALAEQKLALEGELHKWIKKMEAIEHVVDGRADIDRIAKETQALWLAVEALAFAIEMPFSKISVSGDPLRNEQNAFYASEPLSVLVNAVKLAALGSGNHEFAIDVVNSLPAEAIEEGVWTRQGILHRFNKVYDVCRNVAMVEETSTSLWGYFLSWLQAKLHFDSLNRSGLISHIPGVRIMLITPDTEISDDTTPNTFCLLASAKAALMPETNTIISIDSLNCSDIEFAVRLLGQLKGQPAAVASDWIRDARRFLEVHQAIQALLAYATALNISSFDERL